MKRILFAGAMLLIAGTAAWAQNQNGQGGACSIPQSVVASLLSKLGAAVQGGNKGLFNPNKMWAAVVDRQGAVCAVTRSDPDAWPGSRAIAMAKAFTANAFSNNTFAISTANLYGPTQPGGSLYGLNNSNPFNFLFEPQGTGIGNVAGGIITFGGGVALYSGGQVIGGLGISGDTSCADHAVAFKMRAAANLAPGAGVGGPNSGTDKIAYYAPGTLSGAIDPSQFKQPHCLGDDATDGPTS